MTPTIKSVQEKVSLLTPMNAITDKTLLQLLKAVIQLQHEVRLSADNDKACVQAEKVRYMLQRELMRRGVKGPTFWSHW